MSGLLVSGHSCFTTLSSVSLVKNGNNDSLQDNLEINNHGRWFFKNDVKCESSTSNVGACLVVLYESVERENPWRPKEDVWLPHHGPNRWPNWSRQHQDTKAILLYRARHVSKDSERYRNILTYTYPPQIRHLTTLTWLRRWEVNWW